MHLLSKRCAALNADWRLEKSNTKSQWKAEINVFGEYNSESRTWWSRIEYVVRKLIRKKHLALICWHFGLSFLFWVWSVCKVGKGRTKRQGPTSMELRRFSGILLDTLDLSHVISPDGWREHHSLHFRCEEMEAKEIMKFAQSKWQRPGFNPDLSNTRVSAFFPRNRVFHQGQRWEHHSLRPGEGACIVQICAKAEKPNWARFSQCPLEGCQWITAVLVGKGPDL